jgi:hypothetical protein
MSNIQKDIQTLNRVLRAFEEPKPLWKRIVELFSIQSSKSEVKTKDPRAPRPTLSLLTADLDGDKKLNAEIAAAIKQEQRARELDMLNENNPQKVPEDFIERHAGWRLLTKGEIVELKKLQPKFSNRIQHYHKNVGWKKVGSFGNNLDYTYRTKLSKEEVLNSVKQEVHLIELIKKCESKLATLEPKT